MFEHQKPEVFQRFLVLGFWSTFFVYFRCKEWPYKDVFYGEGTRISAHEDFDSSFSFFVCHNIENIRKMSTKNIRKTSGDREPFKNLLEVFQRFSNVVLFKRTTFENLKPLKNLFENLFRIFEFQDKTVI